MTSLHALKIVVFNISGIQGKKCQLFTGMKQYGKSRFFIIGNRGERGGDDSGREIKKPDFQKSPVFFAGCTRLELATSCVTGRHSNQAELTPRK